VKLSNGPFNTGYSDVTEHPPKRLRDLSLSSGIVLSIVTPAYNECLNLPVLYQRLFRTLSDLNVSWEWIVVDDHSTDDTFSVAADIAKHDSHVFVVRLSRNSGSHISLLCGLGQSAGQCAVTLSGDLQDPPEVLPQLLEQWHHGFQVVWAERTTEEKRKLFQSALTKVYYALMRHIFGLSEMPRGGADLLLLDRRVVAALNSFQESNVSLFALIAWMGFRQTTVSYRKQVRVHGRSGWTLSRKLKLALDSIISFNYLPVRLMLWFGFIAISAGFVCAGLMIGSNRGMSSSWIFVLVLVLAGIQMFIAGVLGEYLWRALDEARHRPRFLIEAAKGEGVD